MRSTHSTFSVLKKGVEGPGSTLNDSGTAVIGGNGTGDLAVTGGGTANTGNAVIGKDPGSTGMVDVSGPGSAVDSKGTTVIGWSMVRIWARIAR